jgi:RND family efflux transporter MFP subunit
MNKKTLLFALLTVIVSACTKNAKESDKKGVSVVLPDVVDEVKVVRLEAADFNHELIANGVLSARNRADLRFETSENVAEIYVRNGNRVAKGQKIAMLDQFKLQNALAQAQDALERAKLSLQDVLIGQNYSLADSARIPDNVMRLAKTKSNYEQALNSFKLAEYNYSHSVLRAPFAGTVANLFTKKNNIPNTSQPFCTIIDNSSMEVDFKILESELPLVKQGDRVYVSPFSVIDFTGEGRVSEINPVVDNNGMVQLKASIVSTNQRLYDGMNVKIRLERNIGRQLVIPKEALVLRNNKKVVFTLKNGFAQWVYVETGFENSHGYVVTSGLNEGDSVIYYGNINLAHETPVKLITNN